MRQLSNRELTLVAGGWSFGDEEEPPTDTPPQPDEEVERLYVIGERVHSSSAAFGDAVGVSPLFALMGCDGGMYGSLGATGGVALPFSEVEFEVESCEDLLGLHANLTAAGYSLSLVDGNVITYTHGTNVGVSISVTYTWQITDHVPQGHELYQFWLRATGGDDGYPDGPIMRN